MADTRFPSFLRVAGSSSLPTANPQVERMIGVSDPYRPTPAILQPQVPRRNVGSFGNT